MDPTHDKLLAQVPSLCVTMYECGRADHLTDAAIFLRLLDFALSSVPFRSQPLEEQQCLTW